MPITTGYGGSTATCTVTGAVPVGHVAASAGMRGLRVVLQPRQDVADHRPGIAAVGVDPDGRDAPVQRNPFGHQGAVLLGASGPASSGRTVLPPVRRTPSPALISR